MITNSTEQQIIDLEIKLAHQEKLTDELNAALYLQQKRMDQLEKDFTELKKMIESGEQNIRMNEKPPHY